MNARPAAADVPVDDWLCVALGDAARAMSTRYRDLLAPVGLTYPQYVAMSWMWQDGELSVSELAARMGLDPSTTSPLIKRLELAGFATRTRDGVDERRVLVAPTAAGRELQVRAAHIPGAVAAATGLSTAQERELVVSLKRLTATLTS